MRQLIFRWIKSVVALILIWPFLNSTALAQVQIRDDQLTVSGQAQPQLFGGELQYFRLRGGYGKNIPRAQVIALWNQALDRMVEAQMNTVSFYIPWDFHEYAEGKFDFNGTVDEDGDGNPDYPSRDVVTFFKLIEQHGIHRILVRPGPYINAEWGFLGFGAIPEWFHQKYPDSHMMTSYGWRTRLYDYHNPDFLRHTRLWFAQLHQQVLKDQIGDGKPVLFLQLDNETNFQWQSLYNHDYSPRTLQRYQKFLQQKYGDLAIYNQTHFRNWIHWSLIQAPKKPGENIFEDQDWYQFSDDSITSYLSEIRKIWQNIGVTEPQVLFTLAESYNSVANGLLPNFQNRNEPGTTGLMTVNLYPKTDEAGHPVLNNPFKADLDVKSADSANDFYFGSHQQWVMGPEIQAGWWRGTTVSPEARMQTYLTVIGHGLKAFYVYYLNEGQNWNVDWAYNQIKPQMVKLMREQHVENTTLSQLSNEFWGELQARCDREILVGFDVRRLMQEDPLLNKELYFDAPLTGEAQPRNHFYQLKTIGEKIILPFGDFLSRSTEGMDSVAFVKDSFSHQPTKDLRIPSVVAASDWSGGLLGLLMNSDINPEILMGDLSPEADFQSKVLVHLDTGMNSPRTLKLLREAFQRGQPVINFLSNATSESLGLQVHFSSLAANSDLSEKSSVVFYLNSTGLLTSGETPDSVAYEITTSTPLFAYDLMNSPKQNCRSILFWKNLTVGYQCEINSSLFFQISANLFADYNSGNYAELPQSNLRSVLMKSILKAAHAQPLLEIKTVDSGGDLTAERNTVAFARQDPLKKILWITVKTGSSVPHVHRLRLSAELLNRALDPASYFRVRDLFQESDKQVSLMQLTTDGFELDLPANGSTVFVVEGL